MKSKLNNADLLLINNALNGLTVYKSVSEIEALSKEEIMSLIEDHISNLIGYDSVKGDIDTLGEKADEVISKLLQFLTNRGEM